MKNHKVFLYANKILLFFFFVLGLASCAVEHPIVEETSTVTCSTKEAGACDTVTKKRQGTTESFSLSNTIIALGLVALIVANEAE